MPFSYDIRGDSTEINLGRRVCIPELKPRLGGNTGFDFDTCQLNANVEMKRIMQNGGRLTDKRT